MLLLNIYGACKSIYILKEQAFINTIKNHMLISHLNKISVTDSEHIRIQTIKLLYTCQLLIKLLWHACSSLENEYLYVNRQIIAIP